MSSSNKTPSYLIGKKGISYPSTFVLSGYDLKEYEYSDFEDHIDDLVDDAIFAVAIYLSERVKEYLEDGPEGCFEVNQEKYIANNKLEIEEIERLLKIDDISYSDCYQDINIWVRDYSDLIWQVGFENNSSELFNLQTSYIEGPY